KGTGLRPQLPGRGAVKAPPAAVADFSVSHHPADFQELLHQLAAAGVVVAEVFAVRKVEVVQVLFAGRGVLPDVAQRQVVSRGAPGGTAAGDREKVVFGDHVRVDVVRDKNRVDLVIFEAEKPGQPKVEALGDVTLFRRHRGAAIHQHVDGGPGKGLFSDVPHPKTEVRIVQGPNARPSLGRVALDVFQESPPFVQVVDEAFAPDIVKSDALRLHGVGFHRHEAGQVEVLQHDLDQLVDFHLDLVDIFAGLIAGLGPAPLALPAAGDHIP